MLNEDFLHQLKKIEINFDKKLKYEKTAQLYQCLNNIPLWKFTKMAAHIIANKETFRFTVSEFRSVKNEITEEKTREEYQCLKCRDTGKIFKGYEYIGRCNCTVETEDIKAILVLMNHPELLDLIKGKPYHIWRKYIIRPEIVQVLMTEGKA